MINKLDQIAHVRNNFGRSASDKCTGYTGVVTGYAEYAVADIHVQLSKECDGEIKTTWIEYGRIVFSIK